MVREICRDEGFLAQKAEAATEADLQVAEDLLETLIAHKDGCVGMYRGVIVKLSRRYRLTEEKIAKDCLELAVQGMDDLNCSHHEKKSIRRI